MTSRFKIISKEEIEETRSLLRTQSLLKRRIKVIEWLLPRFHKGLSDPKNYQELVGGEDYE
tara:strand:+ start:568 stop:750 length:183 start_codon:yes stop_codon:yes gene_type:complete